MKKWKNIYKVIYVITTTDTPVNVTYWADVLICDDEVFVHLYRKGDQHWTVKDYEYTLERGGVAALKLKESSETFQNKFNFLRYHLSRYATQAVKAHSGCLKKHQDIKLLDWKQIKGREEAK